MSKTYIPTAYLKVHETCNFVTKHGSILVASATTLDPTLAAPLAAAIAAIQAACATFAAVERAYDPNFGSNYARPEP